MNMKCMLLRPFFTEFLAGSLTPGLQMQFMEHLARCARCRDALRALEPVVEALSDETRTAPKWQASAEFSQRLGKTSCRLSLALPRERGWKVRVGNNSIWRPPAALGDIRLTIFQQDQKQSNCQDLERGWERQLM